MIGPADEATAGLRSDNRQATVTFGARHGGAGRHRERILLLGTHGQDNIGDELLLETFLTQLGHGYRFVVNSYDPAGTAASLAGRFDVEVVATTGAPWRFVRRLARSDRVVFAGGSIVKELGSGTGRNRYATLLMVLAVVTSARLLRRPVLLGHIGVGPLPTRAGRLLAALIVRSASVVSVRDDASAAACRAFGVRPERLRRVPDAAFSAAALLDAGPTDEHTPTPGPPTRPLRIALNLNHDGVDPASWARFLDRVEAALHLMAATRPIEVHALPLQCRSKRDNDLAVLRRFVTRLGDIPVVVHEPADHHDVFAVVRHVDVVVAERFHAVVLAALAGRPVVALPYDVKVRELVTQLALDGFAFDITEPLDPVDLAERVLTAADPATGEGGRLRQVTGELRIGANVHAGEIRAWLAAPGRRWPDVGPPA